MVDLLRDFWIRETGTGQQVAQPHENCIVMMKCASCSSFSHIDTKHPNKTGSHPGNLGWYVSRELYAASLVKDSQIICDMTLRHVTCSSQCYLRSQCFCLTLKIMVVQSHDTSQTAVTCHLMMGIRSEKCH